MKSSSIVLRFVSAALLTGAAAFIPVMAQSGPAFKTLNTAQPSGSGDKVEVMEFFAYSCPHCAEMEPLVEKWVKTLPANVAFIRVPVAFNAAMQPMQQLYYSLEALDKLDLHPKVFDAIHQDGKKLFTKDAIIDWAASQGIDKAAFTAAFDSFGVTAKVKRAAEMTDTYAIEGTPSFGIGGKYVTSPGMTGDYASSITQAQKLLDQVLSEKK